MVPTRSRPSRECSQSVSATENRAVAIPIPRMLQADLRHAEGLIRKSSMMTRMEQPGRPEAVDRRTLCRNRRHHDQRAVRFSGDLDRDITGATIAVESFAEFTNAVCRVHEAVDFA